MCFVIVMVMAVMLRVDSIRIDVGMTMQVIPQNRLLCGFQDEKSHVPIVK